MSETGLGRGDGRREGGQSRTGAGQFGCTMRASELGRVFGRLVVLELFDLAVSRFDIVVVFEAIEGKSKTRERVDHLGRLFDFPIVLIFVFEIVFELGFAAVLVGRLAVGVKYGDVDLLATTFVDAACDLAGLGRSCVQDRGSQDRLISGVSADVVVRDGRVGAGRIVYGSGTDGF